MASEESVQWLVELYDEHALTLHRLAILLGAADSSVLSTAWRNLARRGNRLVDPAERKEYLIEQVVHAARSTRQDGHLYLPDPPDPRHREVLAGVRALPTRSAEILVVSHFLGLYGPELAVAMRSTVTGMQARLEQALTALQRIVGGPGQGSQPGVVESLSTQLAAALQAAGRELAEPDQEDLLAQLPHLSGSGPTGVSWWLTALLSALSFALGLSLALAGTWASQPVSNEPNPATPAPSPEATASSSTLESLPAQALNVPVYYLGRKDHKLYRELRDLPATGDLVTTAVTALLSLAPLDPDYYSPWEGGSLLDVELTGHVLTVNLTAESFESVTGSPYAVVAARQVAHTVSDLVGDPDLRVAFLSDGSAPPDTLRPENQEGYSSGGLSSMPALWVQSPSNGATMKGSLVVLGTVKPQASIPVVRVSTADGQKIVSATTQTDTTTDVDGWLRWRFAAELPPGDYLVTATAIYEEKATSETKLVTLG